MLSGITSGVGSAAYALGIQNASVSIVSAIAGASPVIAAAYGWLVLKQKLASLQVLGMVLIVLGAMMI